MVTDKILTAIFNFHNFYKSLIKNLNTIFLIMPDVYSIS